MECKVDEYDSLLQNTIKKFDEKERERNKDSVDWLGLEENTVKTPERTLQKTILVPETPADEKATLLDEFFSDDLQISVEWGGEATASRSTQALHEEELLVPTVHSPGDILQPEAHNPRQHRDDEEEVGHGREEGVRVAPGRRPPPPSPPLPSK